MKRILALSLMFGGLAAGAQSVPAPAPVKSVDLALGYTTIYANAPPGGQCGCFWMNGGSAQFAVGDSLGLGLVFDFGMTTANNIGPAPSHDLTLETYLAGLRYIRWNHSRVTPYAQALVGAGHSTSNYVAANHSTGVALAAGGGVDFRLSHRFSWRVVQAEYLLTHVPNGADNMQNQLRLTSAIVLHFK
jgi:outer membrane immunogenic protein